MSVVAHDEAQSLKERIFAAAITVFAEHGLSGARMEQIATEAQTTKRMALSGRAAARLREDPRNRAAARAGKRTAGRGAGAAGEVERALSRHAR